MTFKDWIDIITGSAAAVSSIGALAAAWAALSSAQASKRATESSHMALLANERIAENDRRIRLLEERVKVWKEFDELLGEFFKDGVVDPMRVVASRDAFQLANFVFDKEIVEYLKTLTTEMLRHFAAHHKTHTATAIAMQDQSPDMQDARARQHEIEQWMLLQYDIGRQLFMKHTSLV